MSEAEVALRAGHEECLRLMNPVEAGKIDAGPAHDVDGTSFEGEFVEDIDVVNLARSNVNDTGRAKSAYAPVANLVDVGQGVPENLSPKSHVIKLGLGHAQVGLYIPQTLQVGQFGKGHAEELIPARIALDLVIAVVAVDALAKLVRGMKSIN